MNIMYRHIAYFLFCRVRLIQSLDSQFNFTQHKLCFQIEKKVLASSCIAL